MADIEYGEAIDQGQPLVKVDVANAINWLGALISAALIAGLAWWGYQLMVRDVSGVPVVRALEGPMRVAPENPGGIDTDHQGLAVNNIAAEGEAAKPADRLVLAPQPTALTNEDQANDQLVPLAPTAAENGSDQATPQSSATLASVSAQDLQSEPADQASLIQATLLQLTENQDAPGELGTALNNGGISSDIAGVSRSILPILRPAVLLASTSGAIALATTEVGAVNSLDPATLPVGTRLAQLGAFESVEIAKTEWVKISAGFEDVMADKIQVIEKAQSGGKVFYRLRAHGFDDLSAARQFCSTLLAGQANCIPVVTR